jgi:hypothetical protein
MWRITKDWINVESNGFQDRPLIESDPFDTVDTQVGRWDPQNPANKTFRLYDDDGSLYFEGQASAEVEFEPLDYFGRSYGCTEIRYYNKGRWEQL